MAKKVTLVEGGPDFRYIDGHVHYRIEGDKERCMSIYTFGLWVRAGQRLLDTWAAEQHGPIEFRRRKED